MRIEKEQLLLYAVTDRHWLKEGETLDGPVEQALQGGATLIQIREKELDEASFEKEAERLQDLCRNYKVPFIVNDNVELIIELYDKISRKTKIFADLDNIINRITHLCKKINYIEKHEEIK